MKKLIVTFSLAAFIMMGANVMAQQPTNPEQHKQCKEHCDKDRPEHQCAHHPGHGQPGQDCCKQGQPQPGKDCCHQGQPQPGQPACHHGQPQPGQPACHHGQPQPGQDCCKQGQPQPGQDCCKKDEPKGKAIITLFEHFGATNTSDGWNQNGFQMERAYFGYQVQFNQKWSSTVILDAAQSNGFNTERVFLKNAFVKYNNKGLTLMGGVIPTVQGTLAEQCWGYRYVARSMYDLYGYGNTADLGAYAQYRFTDWFSADMSMLNGEGFRKLQLDDHYLYGAGLTFKPFEHFTFRVYGDLQCHDLDSTYVQDSAANLDTTIYTVARKNVQFFAGYDHKYFRIGAEYNLQFASDFYAGHTATGLSVYATGKVNPRMNIFARYDRGVSKDNSLLATAWKYGNNGQNVFFGVDYRINKYVSVAPAVQYHINHDNSTSLYAYLSGKISF